MPDPVTRRRNHTIWCISQNPVTIIITRTEKVEVGGGFAENTAQVGPFTVRIFQQANKSGAGLDSELVGTRSVNPSWGLLADWQADLRAGPNVRDEFEVAGLGFFVIKAVYPQKIQGQVVGYQAELEKVS